jgi:hypothetical protein
VSWFDDEEGVEVSERVELDIHDCSAEVASVEVVVEDSPFKVGKPEARLGIL